MPLQRRSGHKRTSQCADCQSKFGIRRMLKYRKRRHVLLALSYLPYLPTLLILNLRLEIEIF